MRIRLVGKWKGPSFRLRRLMLQCCIVLPYRISRLRGELPNCASSNRRHPTTSPSWHGFQRRFEEMCATSRHWQSRRPSTLGFPNVRIQLITLCGGTVAPRGVSYSLCSRLGADAGILTIRIDCWDREPYYKASTQPTSLDRGHGHVASESLLSSPLARQLHHSYCCGSVSPHED